MILRRPKKLRSIALNPDEILLDLHNAPAFDRHRLEGRVERPLSKRTFLLLGIVMSLCVSFFALRLGYLQLIAHDFYVSKSEQNSLEHVPLFADRGVIYDKQGTELAWNTLAPEDPSLKIRSYTTTPGFASLLGYVSYPAKDAMGRFWQTRTIGRDGIEKEFDAELAGANGTTLIETDVKGAVVSENTIEQPSQGENITLSIDAGVQTVLAQGILNLMDQSGYVGGTGAVMNIHTGELLALTSVPEYDSSSLSRGKDRSLIASYMEDDARPFLNRALEGLYTPGSIVKPFFALAALHEGVIGEHTVINTTGSISIPNPYNKNAVTVFKDNANHGPVDMRRALAVSSNVFFYEIGGGFGSQTGLGIDRLSSYAHLFGIGDPTGIPFSDELTGNVPSVEWKAKKFPGDPWRIGDTYNTSIGQYGFQVTPLQMLRAMAGIASHGELLTPTLIKTDTPQVERVLPFTEEEYRVVEEGMRLSTTEGTTVALNLAGLPVAAKSGTAQIKNNTRVNSWALGFFPYDAPKYAFVILMENGPKVSSAATHAFRPVLEYIAAHPDILTSEN